MHQKGSVMAGLALIISLISLGLSFAAYRAIGGADIASEIREGVANVRLSTDLAIAKFEARASLQRIRENLDDSGYTTRSADVAAVEAELQDEYADRGLSSSAEWQGLSSIFAQARNATSTVSARTSLDALIDRLKVTDAE